MLQQGIFVADILGLFPVTDWNSTMPAGLHKQYNYDLCAAEMLVQLEFRDGRFVLPGGMSYRVLLLPPTRGKMSPETLTRLLSLVEKGGTVVCTDRPSASPSMKNFPDCDREVQQLADRLSGSCDGSTVFENRCGCSSSWKAHPNASPSARASPTTPSSTGGSAASAPPLPAWRRLAKAYKLGRDDLLDRHLKLRDFA